MSYINNRLSRFLLIGALSTLINYGVFFFLFKFVSLSPALASALGYIVGFVFGYLLNCTWAFVPVLPKRSVEIVLYTLVYLSSLALSLALLNILISIFELNPLVANVCAIILSTATNFLGLKLLVFNKKASVYLEKITPYFTLVFWIILIIKIGVSFFFGSHYITEGFIPFIKFWAETFNNPYAHFFTAAVAPFPYPTGMLFVAGLPFVIAQWILPQALMHNMHFELFLVRIPLLISDVLIYTSLCFLLPTKEKKVLWLYFASPILFYICYIYGQLDIIPTALLILSLFFLIRKHLSISFFLLGIGIATKTHLLAALAFYLVYVYRNGLTWMRILRLLVISLITFFILNPYLGSPAFIQTVFNNPEQRRLFSLAVPFHVSSLSLLLAPAAILLILYRFLSYKRLNTDSLLLSIGLTFTVLVALVPPMPGWYFWTLPFIIFFLIKFKNPPIYPFIATNIFFLAYYLTGENVGVFGNLFFTGLEVSLAILAVWSYKMGVETNEVFQKMKERFLLAIAGDSGVGKSTLALALGGVVGSHQLAVVNGDDIHKWERNDPHWQNATHLDPKANNIHTDHEHISTLMRGEPVERFEYRHDTGTFSGPTKLYPNRIILHQGLMTFMLETMRSLPHLKIYVEADESIRVAWKLKRDAEERNHTAETIHSQIEKRKPDAEKFIHPQRQFADWVISYNLREPGHDIKTTYLLKNSIAIDALVTELEKVDTLSIEHAYTDINFQSISISGHISHERVSKIAHELFPNLYDLLDNKPAFESDLNGIHQLFFINYLSNFYKLKHAALS